MDRSAISICNILARIVGDGERLEEVFTISGREEVLAVYGLEVVDWNVEQWAGGITVCASNEVCGVYFEFRLRTILCEG